MRFLKWFQHFLVHVSTILGLALVGALLAATMVRFSPGYGVDERELDPRLNATSIETIRRQHDRKANLFSFYGGYLSSAVRGDFGSSQSFGRPIAELVRERFLITSNTVLLGVAVGWAAALSLTAAGLGFHGWLFEALSSALSGLFLSLPSAVVALMMLSLRAPVCLAIGIVVFPRLFRFSHNLLVHTYEQPHILSARARGLRGGRILFRHVLPVIAPPLLALLGVSFSMAFGAAIPVEALCDSPGLGQLAWQAALNRDLPLITVLTLLVALVTLVANAIADLAARTFTPEAR
jgi:peptide/nickel transport system permease protein